MSWYVAVRCADLQRRAGSLRPDGPPLSARHTPQRGAMDGLVTIATDTELALRQLLDTHSPRIATVAPLPQLCLILDLGQGTIAHMMTWADRLFEQIWASLAIVPALGLAESPLLAELSSLIIPPGTAALIPAAQAAAFLAPHAVSRLPIAPTLVARLHLFGLRTIGQVAAMPRDALQAQFGMAGARLWDVAHGHDSTILIPDPAQPQLSIRRSFLEPIVDQAMLRRVVEMLATRMAQRLAADGWSMGVVTLTYMLDDGPPQTHQRLLNPPGSEAARLTAVLVGMLMNAPPTGPVIALRVAGHNLTRTHARQLALFPEPIVTSTSIAPRWGVWRADNGGPSGRNGSARRCSHEGAALAELTQRLGPHARRHIRRATIMDVDARCLEQQAWIGE